MHEVTWAAVALALGAAACGGDDDGDHAGGAGGSGGQGGTGGDPCGAHDADSDSPLFASLLVEAEAFREQRAIPGLAVGVAIRQGDGSWVEHTAGLGVLSAGGCDPVTPDTLFRDPFAASYLATELAALSLVDRGELDLDAPITGVVPTFGVTPSVHGAADDITLRHLLDTTAGLPSAYYWLAGTANTFLDDPCSGSGELAVLFDGVDHELFFPPGTRWEYSDAERTLAGLAIENVTGKPFAEAVRDDVFTKLRLTATYDPAEAQERGRAAPHPTAGLSCRALEPVTGAYVSVRDLLELLRQVDKSELITSQTWEARYQPAPLASALMTNEYPLGAGLPLDADTTLVDASGGFPGYQTCAFVVPERGFIVAVLANQSSDWGWRAPCEEALRIFTDITLERYDEGTAATTWGEYTGTYVDSVGIGDGPRQLEVALEESVLVARFSVVGEPSALEVYRLEPASAWGWFVDSAHSTSVDPDLFVLVPVGKVVRFWRDDAAVPVSVGGSAWSTVGPHFFRTPPPR